MNLFALIIGGFLGTISRYELGRVILPLSNGFPLGTMIINLLGCLFLGWFLTITLIRWNVRPEIRLGIGTGFTGAFTTFSTFSIETITLIQKHHVELAIVYMVISIAGGIAFSAIGYTLAKATKRGGTA
ncbi:MULTISPECIES: fluoride efflux transporter CrcB [Aneurinibacillus]|jgi:CrcB protein|uniref:Fluoride-specific ion channel FluC n=1 Tax=Aneurinibacillus danicus TaxID=267746 RepID=A0A511V544_9BACL|nr:MULTISPECIES: fluoride efflux transporter CrcB [Aneurinibacillus]GEN34040.1 putative fluoride ion transporter CrcB 1 [Aneurinibacillus danicus]